MVYQSCITKMSSPKVCLMLFAGVLVFHHTIGCRIARSPDKMEVDFPDYSSEREDHGQDLNDRRQEEEEYWQGEGNRGEGQIEKMDGDREQNREDREHQLEDEREYREGERESYNSEAEERYSEDRGNLEQHHSNDEDHYQYEGNRQDDPQEVRGEVDEKGERYGDKGTEYTRDREGDITNYEAEGKGPSVSYQQ